MAVIYRCDRCGALIEPLDAVIATVAPSCFNGVSFTRSLVHSDRKGATAYYGDIQDLCPDCIAELRDWFTMKPRKENDIHGQTDS